MNVGELLRERDRLLGVIEEAKSARSKLKQINVLIAMYGDAEHIELVTGNGKVAGTVECEECGEFFIGQRGLKTHVRTTHGTKSPVRMSCPECGDGPFKGKAGLTMHTARVHTGTITTDRQTAKAATTKKAS